MKRDLSRLKSEVFDVVIVGGGIQGACVAWDAALRGLSVALVEKGDFCGATSANSLKIIHGGLRYLQKADFGRMRQSIRERSILMRLAPNLVEPLPVLVPIYGGVTTGRVAFEVALKLTDMIGFDRNRIAGRENAIPSGRVISREECLELFPAFDARGLRGGALWYDGQTRNSERLVLEFLASAAAKGAALANYAEAVAPLGDGSRLDGIRVRDSIDGETFDIRARVVLGASGPWTSVLLERLRGATRAAEPAGLAHAVNLVIGRRVADVAVGIRSKRDARRDPVSGGHRFLFLAPWRDSTLLGTAYRPATTGPDQSAAETSQLEDFLDECNEACPALDLSPEDITFYHWGLLPRRGAAHEGQALGLADRPTIVDHRKTGGPTNLIGIAGVKYTTAREVAVTATDRIFAALGRHPPPCTTDREPLVGSSSVHRPTTDTGERRLMASYGGAWETVVEAGGGDPGWTQPVAARTPVLRCEVLWGVREEMAVRLADVVLRRTDMGSERCPDMEALEEVAALMGRELGWTDERRRAEIGATLEAYSLLPTGPTRPAETPGRVER